MQRSLRFCLALSVKFCQSCIEQLVVRFFNRDVAVFDIQMGASRVNIFCKVGAAVVSNDTVTGHCADCSFYRRHLRFCGSLIEIPFAAAAAGFVTFVKSNAKALLTAEPSKAHCALRGDMRLLRKPRLRPKCRCVAAVGLRHASLRLGVPSFSVCGWYPHPQNTA